MSPFMRPVYWFAHFVSFNLSWNWWACVTPLQTNSSQFFHFYIFRSYHSINFVFPFQFHSLNQTYIIPAFIPLFMPFTIFIGFNFTTIYEWLHANTERANVKKCAANKWNHRKAVILVSEGPRVLPDIDVVEIVNYMLVTSFFLSLFFPSLPRR